MEQSIAKNISFFTTASILQKIISFAYFALVARLVGVENTGLYFFAIAYATIFSVIADFGLGAMLTRQIARNTDQTQTYLNSILSVKILFGLATYVLLVIAVNLSAYPPMTKNLIYLCGFTVFFDNLHNLFYAVFRANKNLFFESIGLVISQALTLIIGSLALWLSWPLYFLIIAYAIPSFLNFIFSALMVKRHLKIKVRLAFDKKIIKFFLLGAIPFAAAGLIARLYSYSDSIIMSKMLSNYDLGLWSSAFKLNTAFQFLPIALSTGLYPVFSSLYKIDTDQISRLYQKGCRYIFIISLPIVFGFVSLSDQIIEQVFGSNYANASVPFRILALSLFFTFITFLNGALLNAVDKQKIQTYILTAVLIISVSLNLILIPILGITGASIASLLSSLVFAGLGSRQAKLITKLPVWPIFKVFNRSLWPAVIMGVTVYYLSSQINLPANIIIGAFIYFGLSWLFQAVKKSDINRLAIFFLKKQPN